MDDSIWPVDWEAFHFLRPEALWLLLPLFLVLVLATVSFRQEVKWKGIIAPHLRPFVIEKGNSWKKILMYGLLITGLTSGIFGLAGPVWEKVELPGQILETPVIVLLKLTDSMLDKDIQPNRLERAKFKLNDFLSEDPRARIGLIGYAGTSHTIVPLTHDYQIIRSHIDRLSPSVMPMKGNNLSEAMKLADSAMQVTTAPGTLVIMLDQLSENELALISNHAGESSNRIILLPFNTSDFDQQQFVNAREIAGVEVSSLTLDNSDVERIAETIRMNLTFTEDPEEEDDLWQDQGWLLVLPLALVVLFWFRRGWVLVVLIMFSSCNQSSIKDLWYTQEYQAQQLSDQGNYEGAAEMFTDPLRKGVAYFKAGNFQKAVNAFKQDSTAYGAYNRGLAYVRIGDMRSAEMAFSQAIELDPGMEDARINKTAVDKMMAGTQEVDLSDAQEAPEEGPTAENTQNTDMEDLGGGGQEATEEDMQQERKEETVTTDVRKGKELEEVPDDVGASIQQDNSKIMMRKVDDDPSLFLKRKFIYQLKQRKEKESNE